MISHPEKVLFPDPGVTKGELAAYVEFMAPWMLPHLARRPLTLERYPAGLGKKGFWQKDAPKGTPAFVERAEIPHRAKVVHYPLISDVNGLMWSANLNTITHHVWTSRAPELWFPDVMVVDLDPFENEAVERLRAATLLVRAALDELQLPSFVKTTGSKGFHVVVPLDAKSEVSDVCTLAHALGDALALRHPEVFTREFYKARRAGRILVDTGRNEPGATFAAAYTVRAKAGAPVSAPCTWEEIERGAVTPTSFHVRNMKERMEQVGDLWAGMAAQAVSLDGILARVRRESG